MPTVELRLPSGSFVQMWFVCRLVPEGAVVRAEEPVAGMETTKASVDLVSPIAGRVEWVAAEGAVVSPEHVLARIQSEA